MSRVHLFIAFALFLSGGAAYAANCDDVAYYISIELDTSGNVARMGKVSKFSLREYSKKFGSYSGYANRLDRNIEEVLADNRIVSPDKAHLLSLLKEERANARCWAALCEGKTQTNKDHPMCSWL